MKINDTVGWSEPYRNDGRTISRWGKVSDLPDDGGFIDVELLHEPGASYMIHQSDVHTTISPFRSIYEDR